MAGMPSCLLLWELLEMQSQIPMVEVHACCCKGTAARGLWRGAPGCACARFHEAPRDAAPVRAGERPEAAVLAGGVLQGPPKADHGGRVGVQESAVLVRAHLAAYLGLLQTAHHSFTMHGVN